MNTTSHLICSGFHTIMRRHLLCGIASLCCLLHGVTAYAVVFDCVKYQTIYDWVPPTIQGAVKFNTKFTVDTVSGTVIDESLTSHYHVLQEGDAEEGYDWVLAHFPELGGPYDTPEAVLKQIPFTIILRIRPWVNGNPFLGIQGGIIVFGTCSPRQ
ncbi:MAG: hypothetical protein WCH04_17905 [Gammaproteobacteria bacterium]